MTQTNSDDIDEILEALLAYAYESYSDLDGVDYEELNPYIQQAKAAISKKIVEARIDELELIDERGGVTARLKQLRSNDNE